MKRNETVADRAARLVVRHRVWILVVGAALTAAGIMLGTGIAIRAQAKDMMPPGNPAVTEFERIQDAFGSTAMIVIGVEGPSDETMIRAAEQVARAAERHPAAGDLIRTVSLKVDREFVQRWGLLLQDAEDLETVASQYERTDLISFVSAMNDSFEGEYLSGDGQEKLNSRNEENEAVGMMTMIDGFASDLREYLRTAGSRSVVPLAESLADTFTLGERYTFDPEHRMLLFSVAPTFPIEDLENATTLVQVLRTIARETETDVPGTTVYLAGDMVQTIDEQDALSADLLIPGLLAVVLIFVLFLFSFRQLRSMLFALVALLAGICLEVGFIALTIGELNLLTSSFAVILVGLGIDFGIHVVSNYTDHRTEGRHNVDSLAATYKKAGVAVIIGGITTSLAFFVLMISSNKAITQFGFVAGTGILAILLSMLVLLPALIVTFEKRRTSTGPGRPVISYNFLPKVGTAVAKARLPVLALAGAITIVLGLQIPKLEFIYDVMKIGPRDAPAIEAQDRIIDIFGMSPYPSMALVETPAEARRLDRELSNHSLTAEATSIADVVAPTADQMERLAVIRSMRADGPRYGDLQWDAARVEQLAYEIQRLEWNLIEIADLSVAGLGEGNRIQTKRDEMVREIIGAEVGEPGREVFQKLIAALEESPSDAALSLTLFDQAFAPRMDHNVGTLVQIDRPITVDDLPDSLRRGLVSPDGTRFLVTSYPTDAVSRDEVMVRYVDEVTAIDPRITGTLPISIALSVNTLEEARSASLYALIAIAVLLVVTFRDLRYAGLSLLNLAVGVVWLFGLAPLLGVAIDLVSMMVVPLIIGIGTAFSIHLIERYRIEGRIERALRYTGKAILLSALTTIIGFGSLAFAGSMAAAASLGLLLVLGVGACLVVTVTVLPALLSFITVHARRKQNVPTEAARKRSTPKETV